MVDRVSFTGIPITSAFVIRNYGTIGFSTATGTTTIPLDDTQPEITEGTEFATLTMTPRKTTNQYFVDAAIVCSSGTADRTIIAALFKASSCLAASAAYVATANKLVTISLISSVGVGESLVSATFSIRAGLSAAGTIQIGSNGAQVFDGVADCYLRIAEIEVI
jgi:hypothetical protein